MNVCVSVCLYCIRVFRVKVRFVIRFIVFITTICSKTVVVQSEIIDYLWKLCLRRLSPCLLKNNRHPTILNIYQKPKIPFLISLKREYKKRGDV